MESSTTVAAAASSSATTTSDPTVYGEVTNPVASKSSKVTESLIAGGLLILALVAFGAIVFVYRFN